eukprot:8304032-Pyramimonas_sp.AAC.1
MTFAIDSVSRRSSFSIAANWKHAAHSQARTATRPSKVATSEMHCIKDDEKKELEEEGNEGEQDDVGRRKERGES